MAGYHLECMKYLCRAFYFHLKVIDMEMPEGWVYPQYTIEVTYHADGDLLSLQNADIIRFAMARFKLILEYSSIEYHPWDHFD